MKRMALVWLLLFAPPALAELRPGDSVTVGPKEVVQGDLYALGRKVTVLGTVTGDLVVLGGTAVVLGEVKGEVIFLGARLDVAGNVGGSLRALSGSALVRGTVAGDAAFAGGTLALEEHGAVGRDLLALAASIDLSGSVLRHAEVRAGMLRLAGRLGGPLRGAIGRLTIAPGGWVGSDVQIVSPRAVQKSPSALVMGQITTEEPRGGLGWVLWVRAVVGFLALALLRRALFPGFALRSQRALAAAPGEAVGLGMIAAVAAPAVALAATAVGAALGGWWVGMIALFAFAVAVLISIPVVAGALGALIWDALSARAGRAWLRDLTGLMLLLGAFALPVVGWLVAIASVLFGLGAQVAALPGRLRLRSTARLDLPPPHPGPRPVATH